MDVTEHAKPPRSLFLPFRMGHLFGVPFHKELQREIIVRCLSLLGEAAADGVQGKFEKTWAQARNEAKKLPDKSD